MIFQKKIALIADQIHHPLPVTTLERLVISTEAFNRLHNILQTSTAYLTYPSNRTSRYNHSLGCMHLAGEIFRYSIINANKDQLSKYLDLVKQEIGTLWENQDFLNELKSMNLNNNTLKKLKTPDASYLLRDPFYSAKLPSFVSSENHYYFIILLQGLRLGALFHDIGHPPFSHVTERAIHDIYSSVLKKKNGGDKLNSKEQVFFDIINEISISSKAIHEKIGNDIVTRVFKIVIKRVVAESDNQRLCFDLYTIFAIAKNILNNSSPIYESLHNIIDNDVDADRLDFVIRDLKVSGISNEPFKYGRLITSYQLICQDTREGEIITSFSPSVRSLSTVEEFFRSRLRLYKYVIFHHRVVKTDTLLQEIIKQLAFEYFLEKKEDSEIPNSSQLIPSKINWLWKAVDNINGFDDDFTNNILQWDDPWLISVLRDRYYSLKATREDLLIKNETAIRTKLEIQLEEFLTGNKYYQSLYKRVDTFEVVDRHFIQSIPANFNWNKVAVLLAKILEQDIAYVQKWEPFLIINKFFSSYKSDPSDSNLESLREQYGFFLSQLTRMIKYSGLKGDEFFKSKYNQLIIKHKLNDFLVAPRFLKPGTTRDFVLGKDLDEKNMVALIPLGALSPIATELQSSSMLFPPVFAYFYKDSKLTLDELRLLREDFGKTIWTDFSEWFVEELESRKEENNDSLR